MTIIRFLFVFSFFTSIFVAEFKQKTPSRRINESPTKNPIAMKNKVLQLLMLFCFACFGVARAMVVTIGTGTRYQYNKNEQIELTILKS